ncbi:MAG TPA: thiamine-phosphate kinase [Candidatus Methanomethylicus sp.]|nr:thiamine-phosphate kinase [Candidatus Methanomethylicus sp.]
MMGKKGALKAASLGERGIIDMIRSELDSRGAAQPDPPLPHPDDASAMRLPDGRFLVIKTDMFVRRTDAPRGMRHLSMGWKAITMNVSDLAAKGAMPAAAMVALGVPKGYGAGALRLFFRGISEAARHYGFPVLGGDVGEARDLCASVFLVGYAGRIVKRGGARPGDIVAVTGEFGSTGAAYRILLEGMSAPAPLRRALCRRVFSPLARLREGVALAESGCLSSSMDSSDGLAFTLHSLSKSSGCGFDLTSIPVSKAAIDFARIHGISAEDLALRGGEEYELAVTVPPERWDDAAAAAASAGGSLIRIGTAVEGSGVRLVSGGVRELPEDGWEHLR